MADYTSSKTGAEVDSAVTQVEDSGLTGSGGDAAFSGDATVNGFISVGTAGTALTVASNTIAVTSSYHQVTATGSTDTVNTISGGVTGAILILVGTSGKTITFADGAGNVDLPAARDLTTAGDKLMLLFGGATWTELAYANNS